MDKAKISDWLKRFTIIFSVILLLLIILASVYYYQVLNKGSSSQNILNIQENKEVAAQVIFENNKEGKVDTSDDSIYDPKEVEMASEKDYVEAIQKYDETLSKYGIGFIAIPDVSISLPILTGMTQNNLMTGVGTYSRDRKLGEGNFVGMSHNVNRGKNKLLSNITNVKENDIIYATDYTFVYEYSAYLNKVVHYEEGEFINEIPEGETPIITLYRCEGNGNTPYRRLIQGKLVKKYSINDADENIKKSLGFGKWYTEYKKKNANKKAEGNKEETKTEDKKGSKENKETNVEKEAKNSKEENPKLKTNALFNFYTFTSKHEVLLIVLIAINSILVLASAIAYRNY